MADITKSDILNIIKRLNDKEMDTQNLTLNSIAKLEELNGILNLQVKMPVNAKDAAIANEKISSEIKKEFPALQDVVVTVLPKTVDLSSQVGQLKTDVLPGVKNTIAVASGKGGVGKSTVAVNLAVALSKDGAKVGLIDADIYGPSIPLMLGINKKPKVFQDGPAMKMIPLEAHGIKVISIGFLVDDKAPVIWRGPMASGAIKQFMSDVVWDELDYLIFDLPPGTGDIQLTLVQTIPLTGAVIVTTPQEVSLVDARKALKMFERVNVPVLGIVENMSYFIAPDTGKRYDIFGSGGGEKVAEELSVKFLGGIPIDPQIREGGDKGIPIVTDNSDSEQSKIVMKIAQQLQEEVSLRNSSSSGKIEISLND